MDFPAFYFYPKCLPQKPINFNIEVIKKVSLLIPLQNSTILQANYKTKQCFLG